MDNLIPWWICVGRHKNDDIVYERIEKKIVVVGQGSLVVTDWICTLLSITAGWWPAGSSGPQARTGPVLGPAILRAVVASPLLPYPSPCSMARLTPGAAADAAPLGGVVHLLQERAVEPDHHRRPLRDRRFRFRLHGRVGGARDEGLSGLLVIGLFACDLISFRFPYDSQCVVLRYTSAIQIVDR